MGLTIYDVIRGPVISSKAYQLNQKLQKLMIYIHEDATKYDVKNALETLFNVKVTKVNTIRSGNKMRKIGGRVSVRPGKRKAVVTLAPGYVLDLFNQAVLKDGVPASQAQ